MPTTNEINRYNALLGRELGRNPAGEPIYQWKYSEHEMRRKVLFGDDNKPVMTYVQRGDLFVPEPQIFSEKAWPWLDHQWVIAKWNAMDYAAWVAQFGQMLEYPARGYFCPTNAALEKTEYPESMLQATEDFIREMKREREKTLADLMGESIAGIDYQEKCNDAIIDGTLEECTPAFGNTFPGKRSGSVHIPDKDFRENYDSAFAKT